MLSYLIKLCILTVFSFLIIAYYYLGFPFHKENFDWYTPYVIIVWVFYLAYKYLQIFVLENKKVVFTPLSIFWYFLAHLFVLSCLFFYYNDQAVSFWFVLFFKILFYLFLPIVIVVVNIWFWKKILSYIKWFENESWIFKFLLSIWFWFFSFITLLFIFGLFWFYTSYTVLFILLLFISVWYFEIYKILLSILNHKIKIDWHDLDSENIFDKIAFYLLSTELLFIISSLLISVNLINIVRPFPIWWDDLWAYMNMPRMFASIWDLWLFWWMFSWQTFTWIWFLFNSTNQAFFLNNVWWILSFIVLILAVWEILSHYKKTFINIPLLVWTIFISMPMVIFQQAKDMKLDTGLFFLSVISIYSLFYLYHKKEKDVLLKTHKSRLIYFLIIWIIAWFAFSVKFTSLILIISILWVLTYIRLWVAWFLWFVSIFIALFTKLWLWSYMNVVLPKDNLVFVNNVFYVWIIVWIGFIFYASVKNKEVFKVFVLKIWVFLLWVFISLSPWLYKNISQSDFNLSVWSILSWYSESFKIDYTKIYTKDELDTINERKTYLRGMTNSWKTTNEDFWRYFWYEDWINNYFKLPWNLTMQSNQRWEFTDITFIFLALIPWLFLFLPYRKKWFSLFIIWMLFFEVLFFVYLPSSIYLTSVFSQFNLPFWYIFILAIFLIWSLFHYLLKDNSLTRIFNINMFITLLYTFLWTISAFWIVWYWITMYFWFLVMISIWAYYLTYFDKEEEFKNNVYRLFWAFVLFLVVSIYFFNSSFPHAFTNLKNATYVQYKVWELNSNESIFAYHPDYLNMLFLLNIDNNKSKEFIDSNISNEFIKKIIDTNNLNYIKSINSLLKQIENDANQTVELRREADIIKNNIYEWILKPSDYFKNNQIIYRLWTFLKYYISENNKRLFEDSLISNFDTYIYNQDADKTVDNMKNLWLSYLLTDLNAATIDNDPRRDLTRRYENLFKTFSSDRLELIETDSVCLKLAIEEFNKTQKTPEDLDNFLFMGWVNYDSYDENWNLKHSRTEKLNNCYTYIYNLYKDNKINENNYNYLLWFKNYLESNKITDAQVIWQSINSLLWFWYSALFKIN